MTVYMLRATFLDGQVAWSKKQGWPPGWVDQNKATVWQTKRGPVSMVGSLKNYYRTRKKSIKADCIPENSTLSLSI